MPDLGYVLRNPFKAIERVAPRVMDRRVHALPPGRHVSFCFDDFPRSAVEIGADLLESHGWRGTWFVAGGLMGTEHPEYGDMFEAADLARLRDAGHEIGCHTFSHIDCAQADPEEIRADCARNQAFFAAHDLPAPTSFAYPYGAVNLKAKQALRGHAVARRGVQPGVQVGSAAFDLLRATGIQDDLGGIARAQADLKVLSEAVSGWLIIFTHDLRDAHSPWGCTPDAFAGLLKTAADTADIVTLGEMANESLLAPTHGA